MSTRVQTLAIACGLAGYFWFGTPAFGQSPNTTKTPPIQDNSFLIEEAYNQESGVVQHISTFSRMWNSKDWSYTFTQEWPAPRYWRHQLGYTLVGMHAGDSSGAGWGDTILNYRYQVIGDADKRLLFAPRISVLVPTGRVAYGRGTGGTGVQVNLPATLVVHPRWVTHWNVGGTLVPHARNANRESASIAAYNLGQSVVFIAHPRLNFMLETTIGRFQSVAGTDRTSWSTLAYVSPGIRWSFNLKSGMQIVPGVAMPIGVGASAGERGLFLYLSFEHPFGKE